MPSTYSRSTNFYVEFLHWDNRGTLDGFIDHNKNMFLLNNEYDTRKRICDSLYERFKTHDFLWSNQSYTSLTSSLFKQMCGFLPESEYNVHTRQMLDDFYPRALQWCSTKEIPGRVVNIDICKCYPSNLLNNTEPIPMYSIHDVIHPFGTKDELRSCGEVYLDEVVLNLYGFPFKIEAGFYTSNLVYYLVDELFMSTKYINYQITTKKALKPDTFSEYVKFIFDKFPEAEAKKLANSFIGELGRKYNRQNYGFTCTNYDTAMCCWTSAMAEKKNVTVEHYKDLFLIREQKVERIFKDTTSINRFVISQSILKLLHLIEANYTKKSQIYGYNTDGIYILNPKMKYENKKDGFV